MNTSENFQRLVDAIKALRNPVGGCPWDLAQSTKSLRPYLLEETYEVLEAIDNNDDEELSRELGDILLQVILHSQVAEDRNAFSVNKVIEQIYNKIISRHPHVFGDRTANSVLEASQNWEKSKLKEKVNGSRGATSQSDLFSGIPKEIPALLSAARIGEKASHVGFDWNYLKDVLAKVEEEFAELKIELDKLELMDRSCQQVGCTDLDSESKKHLEHELGDLLFSIAQLARWTGIGAEDSLRTCCERFKRRFSLMEKLLPQPISEVAVSDLNSVWDEAKKLESANS